MSFSEIKPSRATGPVSVCLVLGYRCPMKCSYCCNPSHSQRQNLDDEGGVDLIEAWRPERVTLTGGEPFLYRPLLLDYAERLADRDCRIVVATTGLGVGNASELGSIDECDVSLHGLSRETYLLRRGYDGFDRALQAIERLLAADVKVSINYLIWPGDYSEIEAAAEFAGSLGVAKLRLEIVHDMGEGKAFSRIRDRRSVLSALERMRAAEGVSVWWPTAGPKLSNLLRNGMIVVERSGDVFRYAVEREYHLGHATDFLEGNHTLPPAVIEANQALHAFDDEMARAEFRQWCEAAIPGD